MTNSFPLTFLTWNLYLGADLSPLVNAPANEVPDRITKVFRQFLATNFPVRVKEIAREIAAQKPVFISLQEAERWQLTIPDVKTVIYDFVELLLLELKERRLHYEIAVQNQNLSAARPDSHGNTIQLLDRDVILVRKDFENKIIHTDKGNFSSNLVVPVGGEALTIFRGWAFADVRVGGQTFRLITTHLEPDVPHIQVNQAEELLAVPANTELPLIVTGDLNSKADGTGTPTYGLFLTAGFHDTWKEVRQDPGFTAHQDSDLLNAISGLNSRIDYVLFKNGWKPLNADLVGEKQNDRTPTALWPSDHAGVSARLSLVGHEHHHRHNLQFTALGDSIAYGEKVTDNYGYVNYFRDYLATIYPSVNLINRAVPGFLSSDLLSQLQTDSTTRDAVKNANVITISIGGGNLLNCIIAPNPLECSISEVEMFTKQWPQILNEIRNSIRSKARIFMMTLYNPFIGGTLPYNQAEPFIQQINNVINDRRYRLMYRYKVVDVHADFQGQFSDGRWKVCTWTDSCESPPDPHPTDCGHLEIACLHELVYLTH